MLYQMMDCPQEEVLAPWEDPTKNPTYFGDAAGYEGWDDSLDSPTDWDEYEMNADDSFEDPRDPYDMEYDQC
jgi:hypothetical protein